jgi:predicted nucleotidyltransferase
MEVKLPKKQLKDMGVGIVYLFGSQAEGLAGKLSDIDVGVIFEKGKMPKDTRKIYNTLYDLFTDVFDMSGFKDIDIVFLDRASLELRFDVISHGKVLYESSEDLRYDFEHRTAMLYMDFKPLLKNFNQAVLDRA